MENRERDKMRRNTQSNSSGDVNRNTSSRIGKERDKSDMPAGFGQKSGQQEKLNEPKGRSGVSGSSGYGNSGDSSSGSRR